MAARAGNFGGRSDGAIWPFYGARRALLLVTYVPACSCGSKLLLRDRAALRSSVASQTPWRAGSAQEVTRRRPVCRACVNQQRCSKLRFAA